MKDFSNYNEITELMVEFTDKAPAHLQGRKLPILSGGEFSLDYEVRFDMDTLIAYDYFDIKKNKRLTKFPTLNDLNRKGLIKDWTPYKQAELRRIDSNRRFYSKGQLKIKAIQDYFKEQGFTVSAEAIMHNFEAWKCDEKSGYRDEANNCHVFSACGCNPFNLCVSELYADCDWQKTYTC